MKKIIDTTQRFRKIGTATWEEVLNLHPMEQYHTVLGRISDRMTPEEAANRRENRSLQLIYVTDLVWVTTATNGRRFCHNNPNCRLLQTSRSKSIHPRAWVEQRRIPAHRCDADPGKDGDEN